jgi:hypothetical protein
MYPFRSLDLAVDRWIVQRTADPNQFRAGAFNVLNHPNFQGVETGIDPNDPTQDWSMALRIHVFQRWWAGSPSDH